MSIRSLIVEFKIKPGQMEKFLDIIKDHAAGTLADEEGCQQFHVCISDDDADTVWLYEQYRNEAALDIHKASPRLARNRERYAELIDSRIIRVCQRQELS